MRSLSLSAMVLREATPWFRWDKILGPGPARGRGGSRRLVGWARFNQIRRSLSAVSFGLLTPVFLGFVGLQFTLTGASLPLIIEVSAIGFIGKFVGGILGGLAAGFRGAPLAALGFGLDARGMMELILAHVGLAAGIIGPGLYSALIVMTLVTTLAAPPIMKRLLRKFHLEDVLPALPLHVSRSPGSEDLPKRA